MGLNKRKKMNVSKQLVAWALVETGENRNEWCMRPPQLPLMLGNRNQL